MFKELALGIIIGVFLISLIVLFWILTVKLYIRKTKAFAEQLYQKDLHFQKTLTAAVMETQEQVLNNISQDLHDDAGQQLTYINFQLENLKLDSPELQKALDPVSHSLGSLSQSIRSISHALNNQLILQQDLIKAMAAEVQRLQQNGRMAIQYTFIETAAKEFDPNEKIIIYRIFQESINNCLKHSCATELKVVLATNPLFEMTISDNGKGFNENSALNRQSLGLGNIKKRADSIHYNLDITTGEGLGTTITLTEKPI